MNLPMPLALLGGGFLISVLIGALLTLLAVWLAKPVTTQLRGRRLLRTLGFDRGWKPTLLRPTARPPEQTP
ncbi:MAG: hypothetical protein WC809_08805 [Sinimarinibacterium sp.]|jgi:hypothetical protein